MERGLVQAGQDPLKVAADQLTRDGVDVLHTIGGDDTNTTAADLAAYLHENDYELTVVGLPKTIDNDVVPIKQTLGLGPLRTSVPSTRATSWRSTPPTPGADHPRGHGTQLRLAHRSDRREVPRVARRAGVVPEIGLDKRRWDIHAVYVPEMDIDLAAEAERLKAVMDDLGNVNIFPSEGAGVERIVAELEAAGQEVPRDAFGHVKLDKINPGQYFGEQFSGMIEAEKTQVWKSGYFARSGASNEADLELIKACTDLAVDAALRGESGSPVRTSSRTTNCG